MWRSIATTLATLYRQQQGQQQPITLSWLEAPEGIQLLRATDRKMSAAGSRKRPIFSGDRLAAAGGLLAVNRAVTDIITAEAAVP